MSEALLRELSARACRSKLAYYILEVAPWYQFGALHLLLCHILDRVAAKTPGWDRVMVCTAPRMGKTQVISVFFPSSFVGNNPDRSVMAISHSDKLSGPNSKQVRELMKDPTHAQIWPGVVLNKDSQSTSRWDVVNPNEHEQSGSYSALSVGASIAGLGFSLGVLDDVISEQSATSDNEMESIYNWYSQGFITRRQPDAAVVILNTRWGHGDLSGRLLAEEKEGGKYADKWKLFEIPAILDEKTAKLLNMFAPEAQHMNQLQENKRASLEGRSPKQISLVDHVVGGSCDPVRWPLAELLRQKANMTSRHWAALYMQKPMVEEGTILRESGWRKYPGGAPPICEFIIACYDTAFEEGEENDYSARTTWGVFHPVENGEVHMILLERWKGKVQFPELKVEIKRHAQIFKPDEILIEKRASGISLIQELRRTGLPIIAWLPPGQVLSGARSKGKLPRAHASSVVLQQGLVWYMDRNWAQEVIDNCKEFPYGEHDDLCDTFTMAALFLRKSMLESRFDYVGIRKKEHEDEGADNNSSSGTLREQRLQA